MLKKIDRSWFPNTEWWIQSLQYICSFILLQCSHHIIPDLSWAAFPFLPGVLSQPGVLQLKNWFSFRDIKTIAKLSTARSAASCHSFPLALQNVHWNGLFIFMFLNMPLKGDWPVLKHQIRILHRSMTASIIGWSSFVLHGWKEVTPGDKIISFHCFQEGSAINASSVLTPHLTKHCSTTRTVHCGRFPRKLKACTC